MLSTKSLLLGLLVLGVLGMHGLVTSSGTTAAHHGWPAAVAAPATAADLPATPSDSVHDHPTTAMTSQDVGEDGAGSTALALCLALLLAFGVPTFRGRRTTWVADLTTRVGRVPLPLPPAPRDSSPVPRFTVMRC